MHKVIRYVLACARLIDDVSIARVESQHSLRVIEIARTHVTSMDLFATCLIACKRLHDR